MPNMSRAIFPLNISPSPSLAMCLCCAGHAPESQQTGLMTLGRCGTCPWQWSLLRKTVMVPCKMVDFAIEKWNMILSRGIQTSKAGPRTNVDSAGRGFSICISICLWDHPSLHCWFTVFVADFDLEPKNQGPERWVGSLETNIVDTSGYTYSYRWVYKKS